MKLLNVVITSYSIHYTKLYENGRTVYDGGGISPDIKVEMQKYSNITYALITQQMIFDYATEFAIKNKTIAAANDFTISDDTYNNFKSYNFV